jgi:hypothetical protein
VSAAFCFFYGELPRYNNRELRGHAMPIHDWTRVDAGIFHAFHFKWIAELDKALNGGLLPKGYYCLPEQHAGAVIPDILTLHTSPAPEPLPLPPDTGRTAVAEAPPRVSRKQTSGSIARSRRRTLAIRHVSEHRLVALIEIVSAANKDRPQSIADFAGKVVSALDYGVHVLLLDLLPPGLHDPSGLHSAVWQRLEECEQVYDLPAKNALTLASCVASDEVEVYLEHPSVGDPLTDMPLFLRPDRYVSVPLEATYQEAYRSLPAFWREVLESAK